MRKSVAIGFFVLITAAISAAFALRGEPAYHGRTLTYWLQQYSDSSLEETQKLATAQEAVRAIGAQKSLPALLRLIETKDGPIKTWLMAKQERFASRFLHWQPAWNSQRQGIAGFEVLGTNCAPAVGELTKLLGDKDLAFVAARCLQHVGKSAEAALCQGLTNADWQVRELSVFALSEVNGDVEVYLDQIKGRLKDEQPMVRMAAIDAMGAQIEAPDLAVPLLITALEDADGSVSARAAVGLTGFGTNAITAFVALTNLVTTQSVNQMGSALKALTAIAPKEAVTVISNVVVNGNPATMGVALNNLKKVAPELALQMTLAELHSPEVARRSRAISVAAGFDIATPGIVEALKSAANDPDPEVAKHAVMTQRHMLRRQKESATNDVQLPSEPVFEGKRLGEWLKMRREGWELNTDAIQALRAMGSNVIPALLARVEYRDPVFKLCDYDVSMEAVGALISLREDAKPALPVLSNLMDGDDPDLALRAMVATLGTGADAIPFLMKGLTNRFPDVRNEAANSLSGEWGQRYPEQCKPIVPFLTKMLNDPDQFVRMNATNGLKKLDLQAAARAGIK
jgi:HEAT repeat protein